MKRRHLLLCLFSAAVLMGITVLLSGESATGSVPECDSIISTFFGKVEAGDFGGAIDFVYANNPWMANKVDDIQSLKSQFMGLPQITGKYLGHEFMIEEEMTAKIIYVNHIVYMERQPLRFYFLFYKVNDQWMTYSFGYTDDLDEWIEEKIKTDYIYSKQ